MSGGEENGKTREVEWREEGRGSGEGVWRRKEVRGKGEGVERDLRTSKQFNFPLACLGPRTSSLEDSAPLSSFMFLSKFAP
jgi:hypothetical protein